MQVLKNSRLLLASEHDGNKHGTMRVELRGGDILVAEGVPFWVHDFLVKTGRPDKWWTETCRQNFIWRKYVKA